MSYLTPSDVRAFVRDKATKDNIYSGDIDFPEEEIVTAMKLTCGAYNSTPPPGVEQITVKCMPGLEEDDTFVKGVAAALMRVQMRSDMRNALNYTAGGVQATPEVDLLKYYQVAAPELEKQFEVGAQRRRLMKNIRLGFGPIG